MQLTRFEIIQKLIDKNGYKRYLEIGVNKKRTFNHVIIETKVGVDPNVQTDYTMTSDEFFKCYKGDGFDIIFVDGNHFADFAYRDAINSLKHLNDGGAIVMHDCKPKNELTQVRPDHPLRKKNNVVAWNGTVWRAWLKLMGGVPFMKSFVVDTDHGVGVMLDVENAKDVSGGCDDPSLCLMEYTAFRKRQKELLNLISVEQFLNEL